MSDLGTAQIAAGAVPAENIRTAKIRPGDLEAHHVTAHRHAVIAEALSWAGTPYHANARVKGAGADCLTFLAGVYEACGVIPPVDIPHYPADWHMHRDEERYLGGVLRYCQEISGPPLPGDIALWRFGRCFSHGAIVLDWPRIIHAYIGRRCGPDDAHANQMLRFVGEPAADHGRLRPRRFFRPRCWL